MFWGVCNIVKKTTNDFLLEQIRLYLMKTNKLPWIGFEFTPNYYKEIGATGNNNQMNRKKAYWLSQLIGWAIFALVNIIMLALFERLNWKEWLVVFYACFAGVSLTHIFRGIIKKHDWVNLPLKKIIPRILISSVIIGTAVYAVLFAVEITSGIFTLSKFKIGMPLAGIFQFSIMILLWTLIYFAVHFLENYKKVEIESYIWEAAVKDFELKTLKSQLNPHFMFNALNSIRALIGVDPDNAQIALTKLSSILRYSLKMERIETVPFQEEMQTVSDYLSLETIRFEERLKYNIEIDPKSSNIEVPPMMIQTLVENGIKHGISKKTEGGNISIKATVADSKLHIEIKNAGQIDNQAIMNSSGFGINNTKHRLHLLYGEKASFNIKNYSNNEVVAELVIPTGGIKNESFNN